MEVLSGSISVRRSRSELQLKRSLLTREYILHLNRDLCDGCGMCAQNCPKKAIEWRSPLVVSGRLIRKPSISFDVNSCILCGECATICPLDALKMYVDGEEIATIVKNEAFPVLLKEIKIESEKCRADCGFRCQKECPTKAITAVAKMSRTRETPIVDVQVNKSLCIYCKRCESACPLHAISVKKPFMGKVELKSELCPDGCRACLDICPAHAAQLDEKGKPQVLLDFCVYCFACEKVCPEGAISVKREWIFHGEVRSAAWLTALGKLTSAKTVAKEVASDSAKKRLVAVNNRMRVTGKKSRKKLKAAQIDK